MSSTHKHDPEVLEQEIAPTLANVAGGTVDVQVATARMYPRSITDFIRRATEMATLTPEIAASCVYAMPRDGKTIEGPSARLAEIIAHAFRNLRIQAGASDHDDRYITARGEAWDVETNVAIGFEVKRRITNRHGITYNDDMISVTGNAAASIALRNAVFKAVPSPFWRPIYLKCRQVIAGDAKTFAARRDDMLKAFMVAGVTPDRLCAAIGLKGVQDITLDHMATLAGILNAIKEGETTLEEAFPEDGGAMHTPPKASPRKSEQPQTGGSPTASVTPAGPSGATDTPAPVEAPATAPRHLGKIVSVIEKNGSWLVKLETGFVAATREEFMARRAETLQKDGTVVELGTKPPRDPKYAPNLTGITVVEG